jgi:MFS family permease
VDSLYSSLRQRADIILISSGVFASVVSNTMLQLASPRLVDAFHVSYQGLQWRSLLFWTAFGASMPLFGRLTERWSAKRQLLCGLAVFCASIVVATATHRWWCFLLGGLLQGLADGMVMAAQSLIIKYRFPPDRIGWAFGWQAGVLASASLVGPVAGGILLEHMSWRMLLWCFLGIGLVAAAAVALALPRTPAPDRAAASPLPVRATLGLAVALAGAQALVLVHSWLRWPLLLLVALAGWQFAAAERVAPEGSRYVPPMVRRNRFFLLAALRGLLVYFPINAIGVFFPVYLEVVGGWSTSRTGAVLLFDAVITTVLSGPCGRFADSRPRAAIRTGFVLLACGGVAFAASGTGTVDIVVALAVIDIGACMTIPAQSKVALSASPENETGVYMALFQGAQFIAIGASAVVFSPFIQGSGRTSFSSSGFDALCLVATALFLVGGVLTFGRSSGLAGSTARPPHHRPEDPSSTADHLDHDSAAPRGHGRT